MAYDLSFGQWVVKRRKELRLQRTELAAQVGCAAITLRKIESDERRPSYQLAELLAERLGLIPADRAVFIRVARGELLTDRLPVLALTHAKPAAPIHTPHLHTVATHVMCEPIRTNLPAPLTSFVGRSHELHTITSLLAEQRLVTLTGVGGVGKTRLAIEAGIQLVKRSSAEAIRDGIWFIELASLAQPDLVPQAIMRLFQIPEQAGRSIRDVLQEYLAGKQLLLILDNCEHLIEICAELAEYLLQHCWQLRMLATSREPLHIPGETAYAVAPLNLPAADEHQPMEILGTAAAQLFVSRMKSAPRIEDPSDSDVQSIAKICRQLDGIPLALELAAPLAHNLPLAEIAMQLQNQMAILKNAYRTAIPRHQTMHSALVWSYRLLAPEEQYMLASVAVFAGGWNLEALQAICNEIPAQRVLSVLMQLIIKSLVMVEETTGQQRYRLLEPVRQFAQIQLAASGIEEATRCRHAEYFLSLAEQMGQARDTPREREWLRRLEPERDNIREVNSWACSHSESEIAHRLNGLLFAFWIYCSSLTEANYWFDLVLAMPVVERTHNALLAEALALNAAGYVSTLLSLDQARFRFERELALRIELDEPIGLAGALRGSSFVAMLSGDLDRAQQLSEQAIATSRSVADHWGVAWSYYDLGFIALVRGDANAAQSLLETAIPQLRAYGINFGLYRALIALGHVMRLISQNRQAVVYYHEALRLQQEMSYTQHVVDVLEGQAGIAAAEQALMQAVILFAAAEAHRQAHALIHWHYQQPWYDRDVALAKSQLSPERWEEAWEWGYAMSLEQAVMYALEYTDMSFELGRS